MTHGHEQWCGDCLRKTGVLVRRAQRWKIGRSVTVYSIKIIKIIKKYCSNAFHALWSLISSQQLHLVLTQRKNFPSNFEEKTCYFERTERWYVNFQVHIVDTHYSWVLHLWIHLLVHIYLYPPQLILVLSHSFTDMQRLMKTLSCLMHRFPSWGQTTHPSVFLFLSSYYKQVSYL